MRAMAYVGGLALCLGLCGCQLFNKKHSGPAAARAGQDQPALGERLGADALVDRTAPPPGVGGLLAGQVIDSYNRRPPATYIRVICPQDPATTKGAPIDVATDNQGYFTIQGLQPGYHYQLIARAKDGDRLLAGTTWVRPPDPKVLIRISEDFGTANVPPIPPPPSLPTPARAVQPPPAENKAAPAPQWPEKPDALKEAQSKPPANSSDGGSPNAIPPRKAAEIGPPIKPAEHPAGPSSQSTVPEPRTDIRQENIAEGPRRLAQRDLLSIQPQAPRPELVLPPPSQPVPARPALPAREVPTRIPSCVLTGKQLTNFALYDMNGQPWEFRHRRGRMVLLDFWGTWCGHCVESMPTLNVLQDQYGPQGLEVIGIAYEHGPLPRQIEKVERVRRLKHVNYLILMGSGMENCPVQTQFRVQAFPTLVLLDQTGRIVYQCEGLDERNLQRLEFYIQQGLHIR